MQKLHIAHSSVHFLRAQQNGVAYRDTNHYLQFDLNSISFKPLIASDFYPGTLNLIINKFQATLRVYRDKYYRKLRLYFCECPGLDKMALQKIGLEIASHFRNLNELTLNFCSCENITYEGLQYMINSISKTLKNLRKLNLSFVLCPHVDDKGANYLRCLILQRLKELKKLTLNFSAEMSEVSGGGTVPFETNIMERFQKINSFMNTQGYIQLNDMTLKGSLHFYSRVSHYLHNLQEFNVVIPLMLSERDYGKDIMIFVIPRLVGLRKLYVASYMEDSDIQEVSQCIGKYSPQMESLTLEIKGSKTMQKETLITFLKNIFVNLVHLRGFGLNLHGFRNMTYEHISHVIIRICLDATTLESLTLSFISTLDISKQIIMNLIGKLSQYLTHLGELTFNFNFQCIHDDARIMATIPYQQTFKSLRKLHLYLYSYNPEPLIYCKNLEELTLLFADCREMLDSDFEQLWLAILNLKGLQYLSLLFREAVLITDDAIKRLCSIRWNTLSVLKHLTLGISVNRNLTELALSNLGTWIRGNLEELTDLNVLFRACKGLTKAGINSFTHVIAKNLRKLESLTLDFFEGKAVTDGIVNNMAAEIAKHLKLLKKLTLTLMNKENAEPNFIIQTRHKLRFIPTLEIYYIQCL